MIIQCTNNEERLAKMNFAKQMIINGYDYCRVKANGELVFFKSRISKPAPNAFPASELRYHVTH